MGWANQQVRLAFIAALIEGEGTITIQKSNIRRNGRHILLPVVSIANSNPRLIAKAVALLRSVGVEAPVYWKKANARGAASAQIYVAGSRRVFELLPQIIPYLVSKRPHARIVFSMCKRRRLRLNRRRNAPYTKADYTALAKIRELNLKPKARNLRDFTPDTPRG